MRSEAPTAHIKHNSTICTRARDSRLITRITYHYRGCRRGWRASSRRFGGERGTRKCPQTIVEQEEAASSNAAVRLSLCARGASSVGGGRGSTSTREGRSLILDQARDRRAHHQTSHTTTTTTTTFTTTIIIIINEIIVSDAWITGLLMGSLRTGLLWLLARRAEWLSPLLWAPFCHHVVLGLANWLGNPPTQQPRPRFTVITTISITASQHNLPAAEAIITETKSTPCPS